MARKIPKIVKDIINNPPSPINFAYQKNISYSQMSLFRQCPHRWKLQYKDKIKPFSSSIHTVFGTAIHETVQAYLDVMYTETGAAADRLDLEDDFHYHFTEEYKKQYDAEDVHMQLCLHRFGGSNQMDLLKALDDHWKGREAALRDMDTIDFCVETALHGFDIDPPDNAFQRGYLKQLEKG